MLLALARTEPDGRGNPAFAVWHAEHSGVGLGTFAEVGVDAELLVCATLGSASIAALAAAGLSDMDSRIVIDPSNPLDFSAGFPPSLFVGNTDSLGEQIQRAFPGARVVKAFNMMNAAVMIDPEALAGGDDAATMRRRRIRSPRWRGRSGGATSWTSETSRMRGRWRPT